MRVLNRDAGTAIDTTSLYRTSTGPLYEGFDGVILGSEENHTVPLSTKCFSLATWTSAAAVCTASAAIAVGALAKPHAKPQTV